MSVIGIFSGTFCGEEFVLRELQKSTGYKLIFDKDIVKKVSAQTGVSGSKIERVFSAKTSVFNKFTHEKERSIAEMKLALAEIIAENDVIISGFLSQLIPRKITHVLRVCLIADMKYRKSLAITEKNLSEKEAVTLIYRQDEDCIAWVQSQLRNKDPWDSSLYDIVFPMGKTEIEKTVSTICDYLKKDLLQPTEKSGKALSDFLLSTSVGLALAKEGHDTDVSAENGVVTITINKLVLLLSKLEDELKSIAARVPGVHSVNTTVDKNFHTSDIYRKFDFQAPLKVLLVDDEREFVQTLSERLLMRDMGSAVAYDGESALELVSEDEPEVMILDLKMPGIDGIEVLRRVKTTSSEIEVIILTGHGSEDDRKVCMDLGAFAYLHKPVDIAVLTETLQSANDKIKEKKRLLEQPFPYEQFVS